MKHYTIFICSKFLTQFDFIDSKSNFTIFPQDFVKSDHNEKDNSEKVLI